jgi:hypothetical protein
MSIEQKVDEITKKIQEIESRVEQIKNMTAPDNYLRLGHNSRFVFLAMSIDELG